MVEVNLMKVYAHLDPCVKQMSNTKIYLYKNARATC
jgi:hypothetical protein